MTTVTLRIQVDKAGATQGIQQTRQELAGLGQTGQQAGQQASQGVGAISSALNGARAAVASFVAAYAAIQTLSGVVRLADEYQSLSDRLRLATGDSAAFQAAQAGVFSVAQQTGTALSAVGGLYVSLSNSTRELELSQSDLLTITQAISQSFVVSGASAASTDAAVRQLAQGFASGMLRGDEFNSVMENAPALARALADSLGVTTGELRAMAAEGKLTSDVLAQGLLQQAPQIASQFEQMGTTVGQAFTRLQNATLQFVGQANEATGASKALAGFITALADNIGTLVGAVGAAVGALAIFVGVRGLLGIVSAAQAAGGAMALMATRTAALLPLLGGIPGLVAAVAAGVFLMAQRWNLAAENAEKYQGVLESLRQIQAGQQATEQQGAAFLDRVNVLLGQREEIERRLARSANSLAAETDYNREQTRLWTGALERNSAALVTLGDEGSAALRKILQPLQDAFTGAQVATTETARFAQAQTALSAVLESSGVKLGDQTKAARDLAKQLADLAKIEEQTPALAGEIAAARSALIAAYQKETTETPKVTAGMRSLNTAQEEAKRAASALTEEQERLTAKMGGPAVAAAIELAQSLRSLDEKEQALRAAHQLSATEVQRLADIRRQLIESYQREQSGIQALANPYQTYLAQLESERRLLGLSATERARAESQLRAVRNVMAFANTERERGNGLLIDEIAALINAERALDDQAAAAERSRQSAEGWRQYWGDAIGAVTDAFGDFVASGLKSFSDFGDALKSIARRIISDLISTFLRNRITIPITAALTGGGGASGAATPGGGLLGGAGGAGGLLGGLLGGAGALFGGAATGLGTGLLASGSIFSGAGLLGGITGSLSAGFASIAGGSILQGVGLLLGPVGIIAGSIAALVSIFKKDKPPDVRFGGDNARVRNVEGQFSTVFGTVQAGSRQISYQDFIEPIQQFDEGIRSLVLATGGGADQLTAIGQALSRWVVDLRGDAATAENVLGSRFSAVLTAFSADVREFVGSSGTLEERVARLGDALTISSIAASGIVSGDFREVADLLTRFRAGTEGLGDTFARLVAGADLINQALTLLGGTFAGTRLQAATFAGELIQLAGGLDQFSATLSGALNALFSDAERNQFLADQARTALNESLRGLNISGVGIDSIRTQLRDQLRAALEAGNAELTNQILAAANQLGAFSSAIEALGADAVAAAQQVALGGTSLQPGGGLTAPAGTAAGGTATVPATQLEAGQATVRAIARSNTLLEEIASNTSPSTEEQRAAKSTQNTEGLTRRAVDLLAEVAALLRAQGVQQTQIALKATVRK